MSSFVKPLGYDGFLSRIPRNDKTMVLPAHDAEVSYAVDATNSLLRIINEKLRFLENVERVADVKLGYQENLDQYL